MPTIKDPVWDNQHLQEEFEILKPLRYTSERNSIGPCCCDTASKQHNPHNCRCTAHSDQ